MEIKEVLDEVKGVAKNVENFTAKAESAEKEAKAAKEAAAKATEEFQKSIKVIADAQAEKAKADEENQKALNALITEVKMIRENGGAQKGTTNHFDESFSEVVKENFKDIQKVSRGQKLSLDLKTATNMTLSGDLTSGSANITYLPKPALVPAQKLNFRDVVSSFQSQTGLIQIFREGTMQGAFGQQLTEGTLKSQVEYQFAGVQFVANYINGYVRVSKQMLQDLLFLQTYLPGMLLRDFYKKENAQFYGDLASAATGSTTSAGGNDAEKFIDYITNIESTDFAVNGIVTTPAVWGKILKTSLPTTGSSYSIPGGFMINPATGNVEIAGVPIVKANWVTSGQAIVGDFSQASIAMVDGLKVEFFEQDSDNVQRNLVTVRVEAREVLVIERPEAFSKPTGL
jgi:HK97 family phage major capsid protein